MFIYAYQTLLLMFDLRASSFDIRVVNKIDIFEIGAQNEVFILKYICLDSYPALNIILKFKILKILTLEILKYLLIPIIR